MQTLFSDIRLCQQLVPTSTLDVEESMPGYFQLKMPPVWSFYYVNSNMMMETIKWVYDQAKLESYEQLAISVTVYTIQWSLR